MPRWLLQHNVEFQLPCVLLLVCYVRGKLYLVHQLPCQHVSLRIDLLLDLPCRHCHQRQHLRPLHVPLLDLQPVDHLVHYLHHQHVPLQQPVPVHLSQRHVPPRHHLRRLHVPLRQLHGIGDHLHLVRGRLQLLPHYQPVLRHVSSGHVRLDIVGLHQLHGSLQHLPRLCHDLHCLHHGHLLVQPAVSVHLSSGHVRCERHLHRLHISLRQLHGIQHNLHHVHPRLRSQWLHLHVVLSRRPV